MHNHYGFLYFEMLVSFLFSNNTPRRVSPLSNIIFVWYVLQTIINKTLKTINFRFSVIFCNLLWIKFWSHFQAEIIPWSPMFLDFLTVFHMVRTNQESCESWLVGFWVRKHSNTQKISVKNFLSIFELLIYCFESLFFVSYQEEFQPVKY